MNKYLTLAFSLVAIGCAGGGESRHARQHARSRDSAATSKGAVLTAPSSIRTEHEHLHHQLEAAVAAGGRTGARAKDVAKVLHPHFEAEDAYAMPPLGLLGALAQGKTVSAEQARVAVRMAERLRGEYDQMLEEHEQIQNALAALSSAAREEGHAEHAAFAEALMMHASNEEQVLYPATLLIGEYLKLKGR